MAASRTADVKPESRGGDSEPFSMIGDATIGTFKDHAYHFIK
jgi:hypothetical protein